MPRKGETTAVQPGTVSIGISSLRNNICIVEKRKKKTALKQKHATTCECALRIHLSYIIFIPLRKSFLNYASSNYIV